VDWKLRGKFFKFLAPFQTAPTIHPQQCFQKKVKLGCAGGAINQLSTNPNQKFSRLSLRRLFKILGQQSRSRIDHRRMLFDQAECAKITAAKNAGR
jgi:hypothetical protein